MSLNWILKNHKIILFFVLSVFSFLVGIGILISSKIKYIYEISGFYFIFCAFFIWLIVIIPRTIDFYKIKAFFFKHKFAVFISAVVIACTLKFSPPDFRVLADETNLVGMSMAMYDHKAFYNPTQGQFYYQSFWEISHAWDKRPLLYSFLIYLTHTFIGYSAYNGFVVNALAGFFSLFIFYLLIDRWFNKIYGLCGIFLLAAFPTFIIWVTSSGFEVVNLLFSLIVFLFLDDYLTSKDTLSIEKLMLTLVLLAQCRYESVLFTITIVSIILIAEKKEILEKISYRLLCVPVLYIPIVWQRLKTIGNHQIYDGSPPFSVKYFFKHTLLAWDFFSGKLEQYGTIPLLFFLAIGGALGALYYCFFYYKNISKKEIYLSCACVCSFIFLCIIIFGYYWGDITRQYSIRFGVVFFPLIVFLALFFLKNIIKLPEKFNLELIVCCIALVCFYWPVAGKNQAVKELVLQRVYAHTLNFLNSAYPDKNLIIISDRPGLYTVHRWGAVDFEYANANSGVLLNQLKNSLYDEIIVIQYVEYGTNKPNSETVLKEDYKIESVDETQTKGIEYLKISKVIVN
ncbi:MAG: glycosyltransferase family 39 protein [Desulfobacterales bacterium]|nr:glycosyltransferase family 39 protein [Desulfobacterales bacterium]